MFRKIKEIKKRLICDKNERAFICNNKKRWKSARAETKGEILLERQSLPHCVISWSYYANALKEKLNANIYTFSRKSRLDNHVLNSIYESFGSSGNIEETLLENQEQKLEELYRKLINECDNKEKWQKIKILDCEIGKDIYETYLRAGNPTLNLDDSYLLTITKEALKKLIFWNQYFNDNVVKAVIISHDCYLGNIIRRVANRYDVPVYQITTGWGLKLKKGFSVGDRFKYYHELYLQLDEKERKEGRQWARKQLEKRFSGEVGVDMAYSKMSSFSDVEYDKHVLDQNNKIKVLICTHSFFDNPYCYGGLLFLDFYEWLTFLGDVSNATDYDWYIKPHPDYLPGTIEILKEFVDNYPKIKLIDPSTSHKQLVFDGLDFVLTVYGTVGCEYPLLGPQVINAGVNPHEAYDFCWNPKTIHEYREWLYNLPKLYKKINFNQVYEFYFIHHKYGVHYSENRGTDDLFFDSEKKIFAELGDLKYTSKLYEKFLEELDDERHNRIRRDVQKYLNVIDSYDETVVREK